MPAFLLPRGEMRKWQGKMQEEHARAVHGRGASSEWDGAEDTEDEGSESRRGHGGRGAMCQPAWHVSTLESNRLASVLLAWSAGTNNVMNKPVMLLMLLHYVCLAK